MQRVMLNNCNRSNEYVFVNKYTEPAFERPQHIHEFIEIEYVISGSGMHKIGDVCFPVKAGDVFFTNFETPHCFQSNDANNPIVLYNCFFNSAFLNSLDLNFQRFSVITGDLLYKMLFPKEFSTMPFVNIYDVNCKLKSLLDTMHQEYVSATAGYLDVIFGCLIQFLIYFQRIYQGQRVDQSSMSRHNITDILSYLEKNYTEKISLQELSKIAFLSPNYLCKVFKDTNGITITEHIQNLRLSKSAALLTQTSQTISEIAFQVGYHDEGFFRKCFKEFYRKTPSQYRNSKT